MNSPFDNLTDDQCEVLFECILHAIESNSGIGFPRYDQNHPDYHDGKNQTEPPPGADCENNKLFQMVKYLSLRLADIHPPLVYKKHLLTTWPSFCKKAIDSANNPTHEYTPVYQR